MRPDWRTRLDGLRVERKAYEKLLAENRREAGAQLLEIREDGERGDLTAAAAVLGISRQNAYTLLDAAEARA